MYQRASQPVEPGECRGGVAPDRDRRGAVPAHANRQPGAGVHVREAVSDVAVAGRRQSPPQRGYVRFAALFALTPELSASNWREVNRWTRAELRLSRHWLHLSHR